jgi:hypothetical protein
MVGATVSDRARDSVRAKEQLADDGFEVLVTHPRVAGLELVERCEAEPRPSLLWRFLDG